MGQWQATCHANDQPGRGPANNVKSNCFYGLFYDFKRWREKMAESAERLNACPERGVGGDRNMQVSNSRTIGAGQSMSFIRNEVDSFNSYFVMIWNSVRISNSVPFESKTELNFNQLIYFDLSTLRGYWQKKGRLIAKSFANDAFRLYWKNLPEEVFLLAYRCYFPNQCLIRW
jgi:hypothetical protein